ncbi:ORF6N domain [Sebaldella termitidis]|uniref:KilA-N DNA-binding domain-containing protein n=1 Tax=Sebaldella termitidis (strain ATCC 33386 / NCTC 11300) TaxID=526218 RepID=D1AR21_SEBTE|nr:ORF6N domain-containing protein [Sebaldella termitidis]ACZ07709.1 hypothetical protein Sterm_0837 [Sebaldella termitidis ATCC 33386]SUI23006.1 ORF6N domain [Sebaldella termitidis]
MNKMILINNTSIIAKEYSEERVITAWDIAKLHKREIREINQNFKHIKDRLKYGEDYYVVSRDFAESNQMIQEFLPNNVREIILFTETGYLMLVRTLNDDLSWKIQKSLIKTYFTLKKIEALTVEDMIIMQANEVKAVKTKVEVLEDKINNQIRKKNKNEKGVFLTKFKIKSKTYSIQTSKNYTKYFKQEKTLAKYLNENGWKIYTENKS